MQNRATHAGKAAKFFEEGVQKKQPSRLCSTHHHNHSGLKLMGAVGDAEGAGGGVDGDHGEDVPLGPVPHERRPEDQRPGGPRKHGSVSFRCTPIKRRHRFFALGESQKNKISNSSEDVLYLEGKQNRPTMGGERLVSVARD